MAENQEHAAGGRGPAPVFVPNDEMRATMTDHGEIVNPLLIPAKYVPEARQSGIRRSPDKHWRRCRACQQQISTKEDFLAVEIQRRSNCRTKGFLHTYECMPKGQEVPNSLSLPECLKVRQEYMSLHPELFSEREPDSEEYGEDDSDEEDDERHIPAIVHVSTATKKSCPYCDDVELDFEELCNHPASHHGLVCLHVGQETYREDSTGSLIHSTAAVFARAPLG